MMLVETVFCGLMLVLGSIGALYLAWLLLGELLCWLALRRLRKTGAVTRPVSSERLRIPAVRGGDGGTAP